MSLMKKKAPRIQDPQLDRIVAKIYDDINEVINAVNQGDTSVDKKSYTGKAGDLRLFRKEDNTYEIQGRTDEGWVSVAMTFKDK